MDYTQGAAHMIELHNRLSPGQKASFGVGSLLVSYPGYKKLGDYRLSENGIAPKHTDIVDFIHGYTTKANFQEVADFLDDVYKNGLNANSTAFPRTFIEKIYWITLQEEINYPQPRYAGRKLPFQRFYESALINLGYCTKEEVYKRTNNHGSGRPKLYSIPDLNHPCFYI